MSAQKAPAGTTPLIIEVARAEVGWPVTLAEVPFTSTGPVRFHPSLRTAAELNGPPAAPLPASA